MLVTIVMTISVFILFMFFVMMFNILFMFFVIHLKYTGWVVDIV